MERRYIIDSSVDPAVSVSRIGGNDFQDNQFVGPNTSISSSHNRHQSQNFLVGLK